MPNNDDDDDMSVNNGCDLMNIHGFCSLYCCLSEVGVSFDDDVDMEAELTMTSEEQLQFSLDSLRDDVVTHHTATSPLPDAPAAAAAADAPVTSANSCTLFSCFT